MTNDGSLMLRYASGSDPGLRRQANEDSGYASPRLLAVADGMGGHAHGEVASAIAVTALAELDESLASVDLRGADLSATLAGGCQEVRRRLTDLAERDPEYAGMGTTLTAMLWDGARFGVAHIGDSRAYVVRDGELLQLTHDHTMIQSLVDEGHMSPEKAEDHPRRSVLTRAMQARGDAEPDLFVHDALPADRYLLCSDGLTCVVKPDAITEVLTTVAEPDAAVARLIELANAAGGPDNITVVVADLVS